MFAAMLLTSEYYFDKLISGITYADISEANPAIPTRLRHVFTDNYKRSRI